MSRKAGRLSALTLAAALALGTPAPGEAIAPALLLMIKQMAQQAATSMIKDAPLSSLSGLGCKGIALSNALAGFDLRNAARGAAGMGMPGLPMGTAIPPDIAEKMRAMMPEGVQLPAGMAMLGQPLSPPETLATIDELFELGFLPKAMQAELKECMVLVPASVPALGMGMGMFKPMIPQLRQARAELHALSPAEQDEVAAALVEELKPLPDDQRAAFLEHVDSGFYPARVGKAVRAGLTAR